MIPLFKVFMPPTVQGPLLETLFSGYIGQGAKVEEFEKALIPWMQTEKILTVNSGTSAIHLALKLAGVRPGDEVITTPMSCMATNTPIIAAYANIVWADIDPHTGNIDSTSIEKRITSETKAIICVHWGGYPCDMDEINAIGKKHGMPVIEDAAHAFGSKYKSQMVGSLSDFTCFSFQAIKVLTTVDGGALTCRSHEGYQRGKLLRWYGINRETERRDFRCEEDVAEAGYKFHMNDVAATIGLAQLNFTQIVLAKHRHNAMYYRLALAEQNLKHTRLLNYRSDRESSYWLFTILVDDRPSFMEFMEERGIQTSQVHKRNDIHSCFAPYIKTDLPGVDEFSEHQISIPVGWWIGVTERKAIVNAITEWDREQR